EQLAQLLVRDVAKRAGRTLRIRAAAKRSIVRGRTAQDHAVPALVQVDVALRRRCATVRGRAEPADQRDLFERGGELGAEHTPLDVRDVVERRLDRRALALRVEVGAEPGAQVARLA